MHVAATAGCVRGVVSISTGNKKVVSPDSAYVSGKGAEYTARCYGLTFCHLYGLIKAYAVSSLSASPSPVPPLAVLGNTTLLSCKENSEQAIARVRCTIQVGQFRPRVGGDAKVFL